MYKKILFCIMILCISLTGCESNQDESKNGNFDDISKYLSGDLLRSYLLFNRYKLLDDLIAENKTTLAKGNENTQETTVISEPQTSSTTETTINEQQTTQSSSATSSKTTSSSTQQKATASQSATSSQPSSNTTSTQQNTNTSPGGSTTSTENSQYPSSSYESVNGFYVKSDIDIRSGWSAGLNRALANAGLNNPIQYTNAEGTGVVTAFIYIDYTIVSIPSPGFSGYSTYADYYNSTLAGSAYGSGGLFGYKDGVRIESMIYWP